MKKKILAGFFLLPLSLVADMDRCVSCHGNDFELKALGVSKIVKGMTEAQIKISLDGYKQGKGGAMKDVMIKEVNVGVDTDAMAADVYNETVTPGFEEPDAEFIFKKRRTVRGLHKLKKTLKKANSPKESTKAFAKIKVLAFDMITHHKELREAVQSKMIEPKTIKNQDAFEIVSKAKKCTDHSFSEKALLECRVSFVSMAIAISLNDTEKLKLKIKPKDKKESK